MAFARALSRRFGGPTKALVVKVHRLPCVGGHPIFPPPIGANVYRVRCVGGHPIDGAFPPAKTDRLPWVWGRPSLHCSAGNCALGLPLCAGYLRPERQRKTRAHFSGLAPWQNFERIVPGKLTPLFPRLFRPGGLRLLQPPQVPREMVSRQILSKFPYKRSGRSNQILRNRCVLL